ncbi:DUF4868 domain-containing protein [Candidatus Saccharibacteria bacterium]|nr:DUF4868 domain-containing protein [Candidatus Saccharibacteria bacterium]
MSNDSNTDNTTDDSTEQVVDIQESGNDDKDTKTVVSEVKAYTPDQDILANAGEYDNYEETDIFAWSNNLVQYVDELKIDLYFFNKNNTVYRAKLGGPIDKQLRPLFIDEILEFVLGGIEDGLIVRTFEEAEKEDNVLQKTKVKNVDKLVEVLNWLKFEAHNIEVFKEADHDLRRIKGVVAVCTHKDIEKPFYVIKQLPTSQIMKGYTAWVLKDDVFKPFDHMSALKIPGENHLLVVGHDLFVFNQAKLKAMFGYDAKAAVIAAKKVEEIESHFKLSYAEGVGLQSLVKGKPAAIKKLQDIEPKSIQQQDIIDHSDEMGVGLMTDDAGAIIIMDDKDVTRFVNLLNDDYIESPVTGQRYEIIKKKLLKPAEEDEILGREVLGKK